MDGRFDEEFYKSEWQRVLLWGPTAFAARSWDRAR